MTMPTSYRAVQFRRYGGPEVLEVTEVPVRPPGRGGVGVRVLASSVNHLDAIHRAGGLRLLDGVRFPRGTGADFVGEVVAVGDGVDQVVGARVWGYLGMRVPRPTGAAAERLVVDQTAVSRAPRDHDLPACAALPLVGLTALQVLRDVLGVSRGHRLLVLGGTGGVGSAAVQVARILGAAVTATCRSDHLALCTRLGARAVDYATTPPADLGRQFDRILDCAGKDVATYRQNLRRGGRMATVSSSAAGVVLTSAVTAGPRVRIFSGKADRDDLAWLADRVDDGELAPVVAATFGLDQVADAHRALETGHTAGKNVVLS